VLPSEADELAANRAMLAVIARNGPPIRSHFFFLSQTA
jgi:hypothetical protein